MYGIEVKSSMTYHTDFEKVLKQMDGWVKEPGGLEVVDEMTGKTKKADY